MARTIFWDVDTQRDFMEPDGALYVPGAQDLVPSLERLTRFARRAGITIVASICDHTLTDTEISSSPDLRQTFPPHCLRGSRGWEKIPQTRLHEAVVIENRPYPGDEMDRLLSDSEARAEILVKKQRFDVFTNPATEELLRVLHPEKVFVYGVALDVCVDRAIVGLSAFCGRVAFVEDASRALDARAAARCIADWRRRGVEFTSTTALAHEA